FAANAYGRTAAWLEKVPVIIGAERCVDHWKSGYGFAIDRFLARRSSAMTTNSSGVVDFCADHGIPRSLFQVIANGTPEYVSPYPDAESVTFAKRLLCESLEIPEDSRLILLVARLWPQKRIIDAIWAADLLKVVRDDVHLLVIGDGPQRERIEMFRYECRIEDRVHLMGYRSDVAELLPLGDVLWLPSAFEGMPNAILEAMAAGLPVVASDIPGNRDLVVHGETGFLVPTGDAAPLSTHVNKTIARGFAKNTLSLIESPERARAMGDAGRKRVGTRFSVPEMVSAHVSLYHRLLDAAKMSVRKKSE
ncbi:MAG: glycosyltransferase, partial [Planctomycetia bacterium]|nr:glycosyltransferase [Planctomycetia bacterium]